MAHTSQGNRCPIVITKDSTGVKEDLEKIPENEQKIGIHKEKRECDTDRKKEPKMYLTES